MTSLLFAAVLIACLFLNLGPPCECINGRSKFKKDPNVLKSRFRGSLMMRDLRHHGLMLVGGSGNPDEENQQEDDHQDLGLFTMPFVPKKKKSSAGPRARGDPSDKGGSIKDEELFIVPEVIMQELSYEKATCHPQELIEAWYASNMALARAYLENCQERNWLKTFFSRRGGNNKLRRDPNKDLCFGVSKRMLQDGAASALKGEFSDWGRSPSRSFALVLLLGPFYDLATDFAPREDSWERREAAASAARHCWISHYGSYSATDKLVLIKPMLDSSSAHHRRCGRILLRELWGKASKRRSRTSSSHSGWDAYSDDLVDRMFQRYSSSNVIIPREDQSTGERLALFCQKMGASSIAQPVQSGSKKSKNGGR